jgi:hypothetical protein
MQHPLEAVLPTAGIGWGGSVISNTLTLIPSSRFRFLTLPNFNLWQMFVYWPSIEPTKKLYKEPIIGLDKEVMSGFRI